MKRFQIFIIRAVLGAIFAVFITRMFRPEANYIYAIFLGIFLVSVAYVLEHVNHRKKNLRE